MHLKRMGKIIIFLSLAVLVLSASLAIEHYRSNQVYVVYMGEREIGVVSDARSVEYFVAKLVDNCSSLYDLELTPSQEVIMSLEFRPDCKIDSDAVIEQIRRRITFTAPATQLQINGKPYLSMAEDSDLEELTKELKDRYVAENRRKEGPMPIIEASIVDELTLIETLESPDQIYPLDALVAMLVEGAVLSLELGDRSAYKSRYDAERNYLAGSYSFETAEYLLGAKQGPGEDLILRVQTLEDLKVIEKIPFETEQVDDPNLYLHESEIVTVGVEGEKEVRYQVLRENGLEIDRLILAEEILTEPETQIEALGTKQLPASGVGRGSGSFIWPVQGEGIIYPNQGFRPGHTGIDIHIAHGTNVLAADSGVVWFNGWGGTQGNYLIIQHGAHWTLYLHNSVNLVKKGDRVDRGQVIAKVGATGRATGSHLHFEIRVDDGTRAWHSYYQHQPVDPLQYYNYRR